MAVAPALECVPRMPLPVKKRKFIRSTQLYVSNAAPAEGFVLREASWMPMAFCA